jgi:UDP-perosamine 4-acetyltransferase
MSRVVFIGGGGHASVLLDIARASGEHDIVGYVAPSAGGLSKYGCPYLGDDGHLPALLADGVTTAILGLAGLVDNGRRGSVFGLWTAKGFRFASLVHRTAALSSLASHGAGLQCLPMAVVNAGARLGANVIVNSGAIVEHDCEIGDNAHIAPRAVLGGGVSVGAGTLVGSGAVVLPGLTLGVGALVAAGSVVTRNVPDGAFVVGSPARAAARRERDGAASP